MKTTFSICSLIILLNLLSYSYSDTLSVKLESHPFTSALAGDIRLTCQNGLDVIRAPLHAEMKDYLLTASLIGATAVCAMLDPQVYNIARSHQSRHKDVFFKPGEIYGFSLTTIGVGAGLYTGGLGFKNSWFRETGREVLVTEALAGLTTSILKVGIGRSRPFMKKGPFKYSPFVLSDENFSFPSGHTTSAFALSTVLALRIKNPIATCALYALALLTVSQRIYSGNHWLSDCVMGAGIGTAMGSLIVHDSNRILNVENETWNVMPILNSSGVGMSVNVKL